VFALLAVWCTLFGSAWGAEVHVLDVEGAIDPGTADYVVAGLRAAEDAGAAAVIVRLDTPGGLIESARAIVRAELGAEVPVVVFVAPTGARAASAGLFLTLAAHVAVMAPGTTIGAATPVSLGGGDQAEGGGAMERKVLEDTAAWARAVATQRGRNGEWAERAVREAVAATDAEAVELGVVDLVAANLEALLEAIDGRTVTVDGRDVVLSTAGATVVEVPMTARQRVVHAISDPNVVFLLVTLGMLGLYIELLNPGLVAPGAIGLACLIAATVGLSILPFNAAGLALIVGGAVLIGMEVFVATNGLLAIAGVSALALGGLLLFERVPGFDLRVDPRVLFGIAMIAGFTVLAFATQVAIAQRRRVQTGAEALVGADGVVIIGGVGAGRVRVEGEDWAARWKGVMPPGREVRVTALHGLLVEVVPTEGTPDGDQGGER
jgi:membrane-bound serine protease (ClpP class)